MAQPVVSPTVWVVCATEVCIKAAIAIAARNAMLSPLAIDNLFFLFKWILFFLVVIRAECLNMLMCLLFPIYRESPGLALKVWVILGHWMENTCVIPYLWSRVGLLKWDLSEILEILPRKNSPNVTSGPLTSPWFLL